MFVLLAAAPSAAAIAEVGAGTQRNTASGSSVGSVDIAFPGNVTAGSLVVVSGGVWNSTAVTTATFVVKVGSTATLGAISPLFGATGVSYAGGVGYPFIIYAKVTGTGSLTLTVSTNTGAGDFLNIACDEFSGVHATPLDVDGGELPFVTTGAPTDTIATLTANDLIVGVVVNSDVITVTPGSGYTEIAQEQSGLVQNYSVQFRIVTSATTYNVDWAFSPDDKGSIYNAAFKEATAASARQRCIGCGIDQKVIGE